MEEIMSCISYMISKHALNRVVERLVLSQNIKLNKKQITKNYKKAQNIITNDINTSFAEAVSKDGKHKYIYTALKGNNQCTKYIISNENIVITVINNINLEEEVKTNQLKIQNERIKILKSEKYSITKYIYTLINDNKILFVVDLKNKYIYSLKHIKEDCLC